MQTELKTVSYPNGEIQRIQVVRWEDWRQLDFLNLPYSEESLSCFSAIYRQYLVPACPWLFGNMILFHIPEDLKVPFSRETKRFGHLAEDLIAAAVALQEGVFFVGKRPVFRNETVKIFWQELEQRNCLHVVRGKLPITTVIPVGSFTGYLSQTHTDAAMKVNASFFIMDRFDCATVYDQVGEPFGLCVKEGNVLRPPLYHREALLVKTDGSVTVQNWDVRQLTLEIHGTCYRQGENAAIYTRPDRFCTPISRKKKLICIGNRVAAVSTELTAPIPASGFVLCIDADQAVEPGDKICYRGMENVVFGIQVGNSILREGEKTDSFRSRFYNIRHLEPIPFPPSLYPMDFQKARAARIALGADAQGKPMLLWAEGAGKLSYQPGVDSCGASLSEMAELCSQVGMVNAVNLDGGGSAQILLKNQRALHISDRKPQDNSDAERPVPLGLILR